ncbi:TetR/AcrR family transcriptional regulator [Rhodococcus wratislaviensis]|uniref:TetR/AcrR family transcriptional regulator n=1 Tax=Rhodococcus wratislaviensis TaxID=44752 RepID=UPI00364F96A1
MTGPVLDSEVAESFPLDELEMRISRRVLEGLPVGERSDTRERILEKAVELFAQRGFEACSVRDLAAGVGIKAPGIYSHFRSKEEILSEAVLRTMGNFLAAVAAPLNTGDAVSALRETIDRHVKYQLAHLMLARANDFLLNSESAGRYLAEDDRELLIDVRRGYYRLVRARIHAAVGDNLAVDLTVATVSVVSMCDDVAIWYRPGGRLDPSQVANQLWLAVCGVLGLSDI